MGRPPGTAPVRFLEQGTGPGHSAASLLAPVPQHGKHLLSACGRGLSGFDGYVVAEEPAGLEGDSDSAGVEGSAMERTSFRKYSYAYE